MDWTHSGVMSHLCRHHLHGSLSNHYIENKVIIKCFSNDAHLFRIGED